MTNLVWIGVFSCRFMPYRDQKTFTVPFINNGRFYNYPGEKRPASILPSIFMMIQSYLKRPAEEINVADFVDANSPISRSRDLSITWIGHSTFLIQVAGFNILTDPIFFDIAPFFNRILPVGIALDSLPPIDFVIISHNHRDHMDEKTLLTLKNNEKTVFLVPFNDKKWFTKRGFNKVIECMWWDSHSFKDLQLGFADIRFTFLPAFHWSQRGLFDYNKSLWGSWMITCNDKNYYFAGDTAYSTHFKDIAKSFNSIDIALMPIGPCEPHELMKYSHVSAEQAGKAYLDLGAKHFVPMHWGTYYFGSDRFNAPLDRIKAWWKLHNIDVELFHALKIGSRVNFEPIISSYIKHINIETIQL